MLFQDYTNIFIRNKSLVFIGIHELDRSYFNYLPNKQMAIKAPLMWGTKSLMNIVLNDIGKKPSRNKTKL